MFWQYSYHIKMQVQSDFHLTPAAVRSQIPRSRQRVGCSPVRTEIALPSTIGVFMRPLLLLSVLLQQSFFKVRRHLERQMSLFVTDINAFSLLSTASFSSWSFFHCRYIVQPFLFYEFLLLCSFSASSNGV